MKIRDEKKEWKLLVRVFLFAYVFVLFFTMHALRGGATSIVDFMDKGFKHMLLNPFDILPINWKAVGVVTYMAFIAFMLMYIYRIKNRQLRPGVENGSAKWNLDLDEYNKVFTDPPKSKSVTTVTGWKNKLTGEPFPPKDEIKNSESSDAAKTLWEGIFRTIKKALNEKRAAVRRAVNLKWTSFKEKAFAGRSKPAPKEGKPSEDRPKRPGFKRRLTRRLEQKFNYKSAATRKEEEKANTASKTESAPAAKKLKQVLVPINTNMILTQDVCLSMDGHKTRRNNNILIIGGSGSGKTRFFAKPNLLQRNCSYVITDPSGEILESLGDFFRRSGYKIKVFNLSQMEHSHCYNPFAYIRDDQGVLTMINTLIKNTTPKGSSSNDPFWEKAETALLQAICFYLYKECSPSQRNFSNVMKLLRCMEVREDNPNFKAPLDYMFEELEKKDPEHIAVRQYKVFKQAAGKTAKSILVSAAVRLAFFNLDIIARLTNEDNIDLGAMCKEPTVLFCITRTGDSTYNFMISLMYTQLFDTLYHIAETQCKKKMLPIPVRFMLDEFANIPPIPEFNEKLATMRKYQISCSIILQNLSQLKTMYKDEWEDIVGNCDTVLFLGGAEINTLKHFSELLGKETIKARNSSRTYGRQGSNSQSYNTQGRELMTPDEISRMSTMSCILFIRGLYPFSSEKYEYTKHPNYKYTADANDDYTYYVENEIYTGVAGDSSTLRTAVKYRGQLHREAMAVRRDARAFEQEESEQRHMPYNERRHRRVDENNPTLMTRKGVESALKTQIDEPIEEVFELDENVDIDDRWSGPFGEEGTENPQTASETE